MIDTMQKNKLNDSTIHWVAHRGDCENHIENTLESIQAAIDNGIKLIEIDIQLTQEGFPIVFHDNNLKRMFNINTSIAKIRFEDIHQQSLQPPNKNEKRHSHYYIPTLLEVVNLIQQHPEITLFVEVKNINFTAFSYQTVYKKVLDCIQPILKQVVIIGFSYRFLRYVKNNSALPIAYVLPSWQHYSEKMLINLQPEVIFSDNAIIPKNERFHTKKETWVVYEVSNLNQALQLIEQGITYFESFIPSQLKQEMNNKI